MHPSIPWATCAGISNFTSSSSTSVVKLLSDSWEINGDSIGEEGNQQCKALGIVILDHAKECRRLGTATNYAIYLWGEERAPQLIRNSVKASSFPISHLILYFCVTNRPPPKTNLCVQSNTFQRLKGSWHFSSLDTHFQGVWRGVYIHLNPFGFQCATESSIYGLPTYGYSHSYSSPSPPWVISVQYFDWGCDKKGTMEFSKSLHLWFWCLLRGVIDKWWLLWRLLQSEWVKWVFYQSQSESRPDDMQLGGGSGWIIEWGN